MRKAALKSERPLKLPGKICDRIRVERNETEKSVSVFISRSIAIKFNLLNKDLKVVKLEKPGII